MTEFKESIEERQVFVKPEWLRAEHQANVLLPNDFFAINIFLLCALDEDISPKKWNDFFYSELDDQQVGVMGKRMNILHERYNVPVRFVPRGVPSPFEKNIKLKSEKHIKGLWVQMVMKAMDKIISYVENKGVAWSSSENLDVKMCNLKEAGIDFDLFFRTLRVFRRVLQTSATKTLFSQYRDNIARANRTELKNSLEQIFLQEAHSYDPEISVSFLKEMYDLMWRC